MQLKRVNWEKLSIAGLENTVWARVCCKKLTALTDVIFSFTLPFFFFLHFFNLQHVQHTTYDLILTHTLHRSCLGNPVHKAKLKTKKDNDAPMRVILLSSKIYSTRLAAFSEYRGNWTDFELARELLTDLSGFYYVLFFSHLISLFFCLFVLFCFCFVLFFFFLLCSQLGENEPSEEVIEFIQLEQSFSAIQKASSMNLPLPSFKFKFLGCRFASYGFKQQFTSYSYLLFYQQKKKRSLKNQRS